MSLSAVADISRAVAWAAQVGTDGTARVSPEVFYSKQLLDTIRTPGDQYIYFGYAKSNPIGDSADKLYLRRWAPLKAHTVPLVEGTPPITDKGSVEKYELQAYAYGRFMEFSDRVNFKVVDPVIAHYSAEYSLVAMETLDILARDAMLSVAQKFYANSRANPDAVVATDKPSIADLRLVVLALKNARVKPIGGKYHVIGNANFYHDMYSDTQVQLWMTTNQKTAPMMDGGEAPIPDMFGLTFKETTEVPENGLWTDGSGNTRLKLINDSSGLLTLGTVVSSEQICLSDAIGGEYSEVEGYHDDPRTGVEGSYIPDYPTWVMPSGWSEFKMAHVLVLGEGALERTGLQGQDSAKMFVKALGSSGVLDPIDQRQSIGFKINSVGFGSVRNEAIYDYICVPSQTNA